MPLYSEQVGPLRRRDAFHQIGLACRGNTVEAYCSGAVYVLNLFHWLRLLRDCTATASRACANAPAAATVLASPLYELNPARVHPFANLVSRLFLTAYAGDEAFLNYGLMGLVIVVGFAVNASHSGQRAGPTLPSSGGDGEAMIDHPHLHSQATASFSLAGVVPFSKARRETRRRRSSSSSAVASSSAFSSSMQQILRSSLSTVSASLKEHPCATYEAIASRSGSEWRRDISFLCS